MLTFIVVATVLLVAVAVWSLGRRGRKLPPGPRSLPIVGNLHLLGKLPHRSLRRLSDEYGPIMFLRLGSVPTVVVSSPAAAELFLKTHDAVFAGRPQIQSSDYISYGRRNMAFGQYGPYWRSVRKLCTLEFLSAARVDSYASMRKAEIESLVRELRHAAAAGEVVDVSAKVVEVVEDMTCKMVFGRSKDGRFDLKGPIKEIMVLSGSFNLADFVPFLAPLDLQGMTRRLKSVSKAVDRILETIIDEHEEEYLSGHRKRDRDFIDILLSLKNETRTTHDDLSHMLDRSSMKAIVIDMIGGAMDTSSTAIEWTLSQLVSHPRVMKKLQEELKTVVGNRTVDEADLTKLMYLDMVVKESLRLHPVAPLLVPHESLEDMEIDGFYIPKKSRIIVNFWAIARDPTSWSKNCDAFLPERFGDGKIDLRGRDFQLLPFGSGRRGCPGMNLGLVTIRLVVAQLVHCFDWELPDGLSPGDLDMTETFGLTAPRAQPLLVRPTYRM